MERQKSVPGVPPSLDGANHGTLRRQCSGGDFYVCVDGVFFWIQLMILVSDVSGCLETIVQKLKSKPLELNVVGQRFTKKLMMIMMMRRRRMRRRNITINPSWHKGYSPRFRLCFISESLKMQCLIDLRELHLSYCPSCSGVAGSGTPTGAANSQSLQRVVESQDGQSSAA